MAGHQEWWLQKNSMMSPLADSATCDVARQNGRFDPDKMLPHVLKEIPNPLPLDQAKKEVFGGGRRRRHSYEDVMDTPSPYGNGNVSRSPRRHSYENAQNDHQSLQMPSWLGAPKIPAASATEWRLGDDHPFTLDGHLKQVPEQQEPGTEWRMGDTQPLSVILHGGPPAPVRYRPPVAYNSDWRKPGSGLTDELSPGGMSPSSMQRILASRKPTSMVSPRSSGWRNGEFGPLQLVDNSSGMASQEASPRKYVPVVNETTWRMGDPQPFRMDGSVAHREQVSTQKAQSSWRKGDSQPLAFADGPVPDLMPSPRVRGSDEKLAIRERRISYETDALIGQLANLGQSPEAERKVLRIRRGENFFGPR